MSSIVEETEKEEQELMERSQESEKLIEERLLTAYKRIRKMPVMVWLLLRLNAMPAVVATIKLPPQHQLDIRMHKKIIVCEYCGRILIDQISQICIIMKIKLVCKQKMVVNCWQPFLLSARYLYNIDLNFKEPLNYEVL